MNTAGRGVSLRPVTASIGAELAGVDLRQEPNSALREAIREGLARHHVLFFRNQNIDDRAHIALASILGTPMIHPFERAMGRTDPIHTIIDRPEDVPDRAGWHTDDSYLERPPAYAVLRCDVAPEKGGDTSWVNMAAAYEALSTDMQEFLSGLDGFHATDGGLLDYARSHLPADRVEEAVSLVGEGATHPIVRSHGPSGAQALYFEPNFMERVVGLSDSEAQFVRDFLAGCVTNVSLQCRFRWGKGDVAIWDERTTQHTGSSDHAGQLRVLRRCTVEGERPY